ncbi:hypothetical protein [Streptomyces sp. SID3343]|uniref:hypothetical protein n=1 Tax=Streptomyces sp. SID3343 TaxID=2690260 RepID=UPI001369FBA8|nr:hypothetical protein [Streptomyces sp. SID3343]MYW06509.1 hypothetical protein [Streptomyces sp. SID3343]
MSASDRELVKERAVLLRTFDEFDAELAAVEARVVDGGSPAAAVARTADAARIRDAWRAAPDPTDLLLDPSPVGWFTAQLAQARVCLPAGPEEGFGPDASGRYPAPCLFDPHHGPANVSALWQPSPGLLPRPVLCCAEDAALLTEGKAPRTRLFPTSKGPRPLWECDGDIHVWWLLGHFTLAGWDRLAAVLAHTAPIFSLNRVMTHQGAGMK